MQSIVRTTCISVLLILVSHCRGTFADLTGTDTGDCVCTNTATDGKDGPGDASKVTVQLNRGDCGKLYGGVLTTGGHRWFEFKFGDDCYFSTEGFLGPVDLGDCICATVKASAHSAGGATTPVVATLEKDQCGTFYGGILTKDGYRWYEIKHNEQRVWVAANYLKVSPDSACQAVSVPPGCPTIISRSQWRARSPKSISYQSHPAKYAFIHHSESADCYDQSSCASLVRGFQNFHMDTRGWSDIGYNFLIGGDGSVFEGRGWDRIGAHTGNWNPVGFGFCFIGSFTSKAPANIQIAKAQQLINCSVSKGKLSSSYTLRGHRDMMNTDCPGDTLYGLIRNWPHY